MTGTPLFPATLIVLQPRTAVSFATKAEDEVIEIVGLERLSSEKEGYGPVPDRPIQDNLAAPVSLSPPAQPHNPVIATRIPVNQDLHSASLALSHPDR